MEAKKKAREERLQAKREAIRGEEPESAESGEPATAEVKELKGGKKEEARDEKKNKFKSPPGDLSLFGYFSVLHLC